MNRFYSQADSTNSGPLHMPDRYGVPFRRVLSKKDHRLLLLYGGLLALINLIFISWLLFFSRISRESSHVLSVLAIIGFIFLVLIECIRLLQLAALWFFAAKAVNPVPQIPPSALRVAILTTIVPSKEPIELVAKTLQAMKHIHYDGRVDVWILDEENNQQVKDMANALGVYHFSRRGIAKYNQASGEFKTKTKAGNHNAWRAEYEHLYDVVAQMDPDHVPFPDFLLRTLGYFHDPDIGFVVAPQVYGNQDHGWLTRASASQSYIFHAILQRGGNAFGTPLLIGTNHLYRPAAWKQIGGYQDSIIEDHLTSMKLHGTINPQTGRKWRGVYTPDIVSIGEGPTTWTDYFNQQKRWAYGIWEIVLKRARKLDKHLTRGQSLYYATLQFFYPSVAIAWLFGNTISAFYFLYGVKSTQTGSITWLLLWGMSLSSQIGLFLWLNKYNLNAYERRHGGIDALLITLVTVPVYVAAAIAAITGQKLTYAVTAKGALRTQDRHKTFLWHYIWSGFALSLVAAAFLLNRASIDQLSWVVFIALVTLAPIVHFWSTAIRESYLLGASRLIIKTFSKQYHQKHTKARQPLPAHL